MNSVGALQRPNIGNDLFNIVTLDAVDRRHVSERPVMRAHAARGREMKRGVAMMVRLVNDMDEWWRLAVLPGGGARTTRSTRAAGGNSQLSSANGGTAMPSTAITASSDATCASHGGPMTSPTA